MAKTAKAAPAKKAAPKASEKAATVTVKKIAAEIAPAHERVRIGGLGIMQVKKRPARMGRNPATGEQIKIKASKKVAFRPLKELKEAI